jgi:hypothetical protein
MTVLVPSFEIVSSRQRRVSYELAEGIVLSDEPTTEDMRQLFARLEVPLPDSYTDEDIAEVAVKAFHAKNPYA